MSADGTRVCAKKLQTGEERGWDLAELLKVVGASFGEAARLGRGEEGECTCNLDLEEAAEERWEVLGDEERLDAESAGRERLGKEETSVRAGGGWWGRGW